MGPKPKRARPSHEDAMYDDNDESDADTSVHDFRRVQIIHKQKKRGAPLSVTLTREEKEMIRNSTELARKSTELQESLKKQPRTSTSDWEQYEHEFQTTSPWYVPYVCCQQDQSVQVGGVNYITRRSQSSFLSGQYATFAYPDSWV
jgi:hypothetical protein